MRTYRTFPLTATGLLASLGAAAQATGISPANEDMLSWMLHVLLGAVGIVAALASIALLTAANRSSFRQEQAAALAKAAVPAAVATPVSAATTAAAPAPVATVSAPAPVALIQELALSE